MTPAARAPSQTRQASPIFSRRSELLAGCSEAAGLSVQERFCLERVDNTLGSQGDVAERVGHLPLDDKAARERRQRLNGRNDDATVDGARVGVAHRRVASRLDDPAEDVARRRGQLFDVSDEKRAHARSREQPSAVLRDGRDAARRSAQKERRAVAAQVIGELASIELLPRARSLIRPV